jgi:ribonuclease R
MEKLARRIEQRRRKAGMLHLDLPEVKLVFDEGGRVIDAVKEDDSYTHTMIEMFMVEANEAVASLMDRLDRPCLRRIHPAPEQSGSKDLSAFIRACGHKLPRDLTRRDIMSLLESVKGRPESYAVNLAVLKTFQQAEYSPMTIGHFALASDHYCHFTSPIRRYPDLTIHRLLSDYCRGRMDSRPPEDTPELRKLAEHCNAAERRAQAAEEELREVLILQFLETKVGESFDGVITGVANFGIFVQSPRFLVEGLVRLEDLGDDWWDVQAQYGQVTGEHSGKRYRIGDLLSVRIAGVDVARRRLNLVPEPRDKDAKRQAKPPDEAHRPRGRKKTRR